MAAKKKSVAKKSAVAAKPAPVAKKKTVAAPVKVTSIKVTKPVAKASAVKPAPSTPTKSKISPEQRWKLVAEAAYYLAEKRHFAAGHSEADWLTAERLVNAKLKS